MSKVSLRPQKVSDAKRFYKILNNPHFRFFHVRPKSVEAEKEYLRSTYEKRKNNVEYGYSIMYDGKLVGGCGVKIDQHRKYIGELGYFLDENYWNKGITTKAVKLLEDIAFSDLGLKRVEILMIPRNVASEMVAIKCGYKKEGLMKKALDLKGKLSDAFLYAKVV